MVETSRVTEIDQRQRLKDDFAFYARNCLFIRDKETAETKPFRLNKAQSYIHECLEAQRTLKGYVRAIILKGRQQGCSTYTEGRFMWLTTHTRGYQAFILTHEEDATKNLFEMAKRYYNNLPTFVKPSIIASNDKSLRFGELDSGYRIGTAGNKSVGRSMTNHLFHGSEVAFWPNAGEHAKGILQTVPFTEGTEIIYESTANGLNNFFHQQWREAETGESDFIAIFVPWFWQDEYQRAVAKDFERTEEEQDLVDLYDLNDKQLYWRRMKVIELSADGQDGEKAFKQEYPNTSAEAFQVSGGDGLIKSDVVLRARNNTASASGTFFVGVDPSRGGDRFSTINRAGRKMWKKQSFHGEQCNTLGKAVSICVELLDTVDPVIGRKPDVMMVDAGGGAELVDRLHELGYENVKAIAFGGTPIKVKQYRNKRCEMWGELNAWLCDENLPPDIPDDDSLQADYCASPYDRDSNDRICLWKKEKIKEKYGFSPDGGDASALTFAEPGYTGNVRTISTPPQMKRYNSRSRR